MEMIKFKLTNEILEMDTNALEWWKEWKDIVIKIGKSYGN